MPKLSQTKHCVHQNYDNSRPARETITSEGPGLMAVPGGQTIEREAFRDVR